MAWPRAFALCGVHLRSCVAKCVGDCVLSLPAAFGIAGALLARCPPICQRTCAYFSINHRSASANIGQHDGQHRSTRRSTRTQKVALPGGFVPRNVIKYAWPSPNLFLINILIFCLVALRTAVCATQTRLVERLLGLMLTVVLTDVDRRVDRC